MTGLALVREASPPDVTQIVTEKLTAALKGPSLQNNLRASSVGFACDRFHFYSLTEYRKPPDLRLSNIFRMGNLIEGYGIDLLREAGFKVDAQQKEYRLEKPLITCHIDGMLSPDGKEWFPFDIKSINDHDFGGLNSETGDNPAPEDFLLSKRVHMRNYPAQILTYMLATNSEFGYLVFVNKQTGELKAVLFHLDDSSWRYMDEIVKRAERVYKARDEKAPPSRTTDLELCKRCDFRDACLPDLKYGEGVKVIESPELVELLETRERNEAARKKYEEADRRIKDALKSLPVGEKVCGDWLIQITERERKAYQVSDGVTRTTKIVKMMEDK